MLRTRERFDQLYAEAMNANVPDNGIDRDVNSGNPIVNFLYQKAARRGVLNALHDPNSHINFDYYGHTKSAFDDLVRRFEKTLGKWTADLCYDDGMGNQAISAVFSKLYSSGFYEKSGVRYGIRKTV